MALKLPASREDRMKLLVVGALLLILGLHCITHEWQQQRPLSKLTAQRRAQPPLELVPFAPAPGSMHALAQADLHVVRAPQGVSKWTLPPAVSDAHQSLAHPFFVYVPSSIATSSAYGAAAVSRAPLVLSLHGRGGSGESEARAWAPYSERHGWIVLCPTLLASARADDALLEHTLSFLTAIVDGLVAASASLTINDAGTMPAPLGRLIDFSAVLLTAHSAGGYSWLPFLLQRPNHWTHASCRSCNLWRRHVDEVLLPNTERMAVAHSDASSEVAASPPSPGVASAAHIAAWSRYFSQRSLLLQWGELDHARIITQTRELRSVLEESFGFTVQSQELAGEKHESRIDVTALWWSTILE